MDSSSRAESERSVTSARGSFPSGWRSAVFGRTCGSTANPDDRRCGTRTLPTAPVAPATKTVITGASVYTIEGLRTRRRPAEGERRRSPGQARNQAESLKLFAARGVEDGLAWTKARVRDDRIHLAPGGAQHAQNRHASARAEYAAALVEIRAARGEHQHGCSGRTGENRGKRPARTRLGLQPEARGQLPGLGGIAAPRGGDNGLHGASVPPRIRWDGGDERFLSDVLDFERWLP